jgi:hypothetical protein
MPLNITNGSTTPKPNGVDFLDEYGEHIETLYETGSRPLTAVGGTANVVTATMAIDVTAAGLVDGLCVSITWTQTNTSNVTLAINGGAAIPVVDARGTALVAAVITAGLTSVLRYTAGQWRIISGFGADAATGGPTDQTFTATGTWTKPSNYDDDTIVMVELWGGGGGGGRGQSGNLNVGGGGGGGGYSRQFFRIGDLPGSVSISIGAGGAAAAAAGNPGSNGGNTTFGSFLTAFGGGGGGNHISTGGGGGGAISAGAGSTPGRIGGGGSGTDASTQWGGAGGGAGNTVAANNGAGAFMGGGGGANGNAAALGGTSTFGGRGGNGPTAGVPDNGVAPSGGGGGGGPNNSALLAGNGARGQARIRILG